MIDQKKKKKKKTKKSKSETRDSFWLSCIDNFLQNKIRILRSNKLSGFKTIIPKENHKNKIPVLIIQPS